MAAFLLVFWFWVLVLWQQVPTEAEVSLHLRNLETVPVEMVVNSVCLHFPSWGDGGWGFLSAGTLKQSPGKPEDPSHSEKSEAQRVLAYVSSSDPGSWRLNRFSNAECPSITPATGHQNEVTIMCAHLLEPPLCTEGGSHGSVPCFTLREPLPSCPAGALLRLTHGVLGTHRFDLWPSCPQCHFCLSPSVSCLVSSTAFTVFWQQGTVPELEMCSLDHSFLFYRNNVPHKA